MDSADKALTCIAALALLAVFLFAGDPDITDAIRERIFSTRVDVE